MSSVHDTAHYESQGAGQPVAALSLALPEDVSEALQRHAEEVYPHECCGILLGKLSEETITVHEALRAGNSRLDSAHNRYHIEPIDLIRAQREGRTRSLEIVGFYHSHPDHPAFWSPTDLAEAHWFGCAYLITSVDGSTGQPRAHQTNAFFLAGADEETKALQQMSVAAHAGTMQRQDVG